MGKAQYTVNEHFVPKFYLESFADTSGVVWLYDRREDKLFYQAPENICKKRNLYETRAEKMNPAVGDFILRNQIEDSFCSAEGTWSQLLRKVIKVCCSNVGRNALICSSEEKKGLADFVANLILRNPWTMNNADLDEISEAKGLDETKVFAQLIEQLGIGKIDSLLKHINKSNHFNSEFGSQKLLSDKLLSLKMCFIYNENGDFVTSSYPALCCVRNDEEVTDVMVPLSPNVLLLYGFEDSKAMSRNRIGKNSNFSILLKFLFLSAYSPDKARFIIANRKESLIGLDDHESIRKQLEKMDSLK